MLPQGKPMVLGQRSPDKSFNYATLYIDNLKSGLLKGKRRGGQKYCPVVQYLWKNAGGSVQDGLLLSPARSKAGSSPTGQK